MTVQKLQDQGLLLCVLNKLDTFADIARCSSVCRSWHSAAYELQPERLIFPGYTYQGGEKHFMQKSDTRHVYRWLSKKNRVDAFTQLQYLRLGLAYGFSQECYEDNTLPAFCHAVLRFASNAPLQICNLDGNFDFEAAVEVLPASIKHLQLTGYQAQMPQGISLSKFAKFTGLETLIISLSDGDTGPSCPVSESAHFELEMTFPHLRHLFLFPWPTQLGQGCTFDVLLPKVRYAAMLIPARQAKAVMLLPNLEYLSLVLLDSQDEAMAKFRAYPYLRVEEASQLKRLKVYKWEAAVTLTVNKANLEFEIHGDRQDKGRKQ